MDDLFKELFSCCDGDFENCWNKFSRNIRSWIYAKENKENKQYLNSSIEPLIIGRVKRWITNVRNKQYKRAKNKHTLRWLINYINKLIEENEKAVDEYGINEVENLESLIDCSEIDFKINWKKCEKQLKLLIEEKIDVSNANKDQVRILLLDIIKYAREGKINKPWGMAINWINKYLKWIKDVVKWGFGIQTVIFFEELFCCPDDLDEIRKHWKIKCEKYFVERIKSMEMEKKEKGKDKSLNSRKRTKNPIEFYKISDSIPYAIKLAKSNEKTGPYDIVIEWIVNVLAANGIKTNYRPDDPRGDIIDEYLYPDNNDISFDEFEINRNCKALWIATECIIDNELYYKIFEMRCKLGMTLEKIASLLGISKRAAEGKWLRTTKKFKLSAKKRNKTLRKYDKAFNGMNVSYKGKIRLKNLLEKMDYHMNWSEKLLFILYYALRMPLEDIQELFYNISISRLEEELEGVRLSIVNIIGKYGK